MPMGFSLILSGPEPYYVHCARRLRQLASHVFRNMRGAAKVPLRDCLRETHAGNAEGSR